MSDIAVEFTASYLEGDFIPFGVMRDFSKTYTSKTLFPLFKNRLLDKSRSEYVEYLEWLGLSKETVTDMDELSRSGGLRVVFFIGYKYIENRQKTFYYLRYKTSRAGLTSSPTCLPGQGGCLIAMWSV